jgi:assimilatory nitrate reductase catalytic subunit
MGGREVGGMANLLSAHRDLNNPQHRAEIAEFWGVPDVPAQPGKTAVEMFEAVRCGEIKALWIACTNPAQSMPDLNLVREALAKAELVVVQEAYRHTDTTEYADVLLPASSWGEKEGTVTNSERRITRVRKAFAAPGEARADWEIVVDFAHRLDARLNLNRAHLFPHLSVEDIFNEHRETTRGRDLDITGLSYALLDQIGPQHWPYPEGAGAAKERLYTDGIYPTASGRAKFEVTPYLPVAEETDLRFPLHLLTGRLRDQWHGMSRTGTVAQLFNHVEEPFLSMHKSDMERRGLKNGDVAKIKSRRGEIMVRVDASDEVHPAQVFMPMHWGGQFMKGAGVNAVTVPAFDPISKQPELKHAAVQVEKINLPHQLVAMQRFSALELGRSQWLFDQLQPLLERFDYATLGLAGRDDMVVVLRGYCADRASDAVLDALDELLLLNEADKTVRYVDARRKVEKVARVCGGVVQGVCLSGETAAQEWLKNMMVKGASTEAVRPWVLAPISTPPQGTLNRGRIVCNCFDVSSSEIQAVVQQGADFAGLQEKLKCGTECGTCISEIKRMLPRSGVVSTHEQKQVA